MKIRFKNLGQIKDTELDLKPLTVIIGPNNSNKTYVAYCTYGLMQAANSISVPVLEVNDDDDGLWTLTVSKEMLLTFRSFVDTTAVLFRATLPSYFASSNPAMFAGTDVSIIFSDEEILERVKEPFEFPIRTRSSEISISFVSGRIELRQERHDGIPILPVAERINRQTASVIIGKWLAAALFPTPFVLPAERNAFVVTYKALVSGRNKEVVARRTPQRRGNDTAEQPVLFEGELSFRYPQPVEDFLQFLYDSEQPWLTGDIAEYSSIAADIEEHLQGGNRTRYRSSGMGHELAVEIDDSLTIDLHNASSSIKQLAPLLVYLRQRARKNDLIVVDEPEMNLHPEGQAKLLEILAILVNRGINVLITTHSPYIMQHLNNLVHNYDVKRAEELLNPQGLYLEDRSAFLHDDQVSAYEMRNFELISLKDPDYGIRWDTLSDVALDLHEKYYRVTKPGETLHAEAARK